MKQGNMTGRHLLAMCVTTSIFALTAAPAYAQAAEPKPSQSQSDSAAPQADGGQAPKANNSILTGDIVVTANRRSENLQNVGISVTAFGGEAMTKLGFHTTSDMAKLTPSIGFYQFSPSVSNINIRGVVQNDFSDHLEAPIAVYQDETYVGSSGGVSVPFFDLERVEVLRGPQGTLFGRNATGGLFHFISAAPTEELSGYAQASYGRFNAYNIQGAISGPITENILGRIAFTRNKSDSPFFDTFSGRRDLSGDTDNYAIRAQLLFKLDDDTQLRLLGRYNHDNQHGPAYSEAVTVPNADGLGRLVGPNEIVQYPNIVTGGTITAPCAGCNVVGYRDHSSNPWRVETSDPGFFKRNIYDGQAKLTHNFGGVTLTSMTDFLVINKSTDLDADGSQAQFFTYGTTQRYHQFSQELRINGKSDSLDWVAGAYYLNMKGKYTGYIDVDLSPYVGKQVCIGTSCPPGGNTPLLLDTNYSLQTTSVAAFAQGDYKIDSEFSVIAGVRLTHDRKRFAYAFSSPPTLPPSVIYNESTNPDAVRNFDNVSAKLEVDYKPDGATLFFGSVTRGHKGGNWAAPIFPPIVPEQFAHKQEVLTSYELGVKKRFLDGRATFNASAFYYDYHNYQAFQFIKIAQTITNVNAIVYGGEAEFKVSPIRGLDVALNASTVHSKVKDIVLPSGRHVNRELPNTPKISLSGLLRYGFDFFGGTLAAQASGQYKSKYYLTVLNEPANLEKRYATLDLRLSWTTPDDKLELAVYGENVTSTAYRVYGIDVSPASLGIQVFAPPATYGASVRYKF